MSKLKWLLMLLVLTGCNMSGCRSGLFNTDPGIDVEQREDGTRVLLDTPRMWRDWTESVDMEIQREVDGAEPSGGGTWSERWLRSIRSLQDGRHENAPKYSAYIIESRRKAGLPELEGYR